MPEPRKSHHQRQISSFSLHLNLPTLSHVLATVHHDISLHALSRSSICASPSYIDITATNHQSSHNGLAMVIIAVSTGTATTTSLVHTSPAKHNHHGAQRARRPRDPKILRPHQIRRISHRLLTTTTTTTTTALQTLVPLALHSLRHILRTQGCASPRPRVRIAPPYRNVVPTGL